MPNRPYRISVVAGVALLVAGFTLQLVLSSRRNSVTWDEGHHLFSGYMSWKHTDYGLNPEVPPLVKMVAAAPLLGMDLLVPPLQGRFFKTECFVDGRDFLFQNDFNRMLFRARMAAALFSLLLGLLVFAAARAMFSTPAAFVALALLTFDPNFLAHGALVTTDVGSALTIFATIYAFYRWRSAPSWSRLILVGLAAGLALVTKFTGVLVFPMLALLALCEFALPGVPPARLGSAADPEPGSRGRLALHLIGGLAATAAIAWLVTWAFYGFRYSARPAGLALHPSLENYLPQLANQRAAHLIAFVARLHLLPESWLYGLADTKITADSYTSYFFGHVYPHGNWLYFPAAFAIKSTLPFLILFLLTAVLLIARRIERPREVLYLTLPPVLYFVVAMTSNMNIGARHLLPIYPFFYILGAGAAWTLIRARPIWLYPVAALVLWQAVDSVYMYPAYMAFGNDLWGGPPAVHRYLSDANVDWGQQLNDVRAYLNSRGISSSSPDTQKVPLDARSCWFAYFPAGVVDPAAYGIPCRPLPTTNLLWWLDQPTHVPPTIDGPVLISDSDLEGIEFGEGPLNPYEQFRHLRPTTVIDYGVDVYDGHFNIPTASGLDHAQISADRLRQHRPDQALIEAQQAVALAPNLVNPQVALGDALAALNRNAEARACYQRALTLAQTVEPQLQTGWVHDLKARLAAP
ncbi:MAG TPA: glycosyltransferase family 39 protein [Acidobacteriaceae bacterium]|jgi:4-amino-4-deoxy-L-arabinose transferase-like glycosyltransferase